MAYFHKKYSLYIAIAFSIFPINAYSWGNHTAFTDICIRGIENKYRNQQIIFEPINIVLKDIGFNSLDEFSDHLKIRKSHVPISDIKKSNWKDVVVAASVEPDFGMDQELNVSDDQKMMGGFHGLSSQGFRHMYYHKWEWSRPLQSFHVPLREMGEAHKRAALYFDLAQKAYKKGHFFWAFRFLGWGIHYVQDLAQPYHVSQFGSFDLLALSKIFKSWGAVISETTRLVSNFHLSFEEYIDYNLMKKNNWVLVANGFSKKDFFNQYNGSIDNELVKLSKEFVKPLSKIIELQNDWVGKELFDSGLDLGSGMKNSDGTDKIRFLQNECSKDLEEQILIALSNAGGACQWYIQRFLNTL